LEIAKSGWAEQIARLDIINNAYNISGGKPEEKGQFREIDGTGKMILKWIS
jgi:hypothetical protein